MALKTLGFLDFESGKVFKRKSDRTQAQNRRAKATLLKEEQHLHDLTNQLKAKYDKA